MATELGTGYVSIVAETSKLEAGIKKALEGGGRSADMAGKDIGSRISAQASKALKSGWRPDQDIMAGIPNTKLDRIGARIGQVIGKGAVVGLRGKQIGAEFGQSFASGVGSVGLGRVISGWRSELGNRGVMNNIGMVAGKALSSGLTLGAGAAIAGIGLSLTKGFDRLVKLDTAKNKLESLNKAAAKFGRPMVDVEQAVKDVTDVVSGTPFSLDEAFGTAVGAIGAGVKDIKGYMTTVADAAAIGGTSMAEIGDVFQDIVNKGNVTGESLSRLDSRFPASSWIRASVTASGQDFDALLAKGEITMAMLQQSINDNAQGMAQGLGNTLQGAIMNMQTAVARVGANFLTALFGGDSGDPAQNMRDSINTITTKLNELGAWISANKEQIRGFFSSAADAARGLVGILGNILSFLKEHPGAIQAVVVAFVAWQGITGIAAVTSAVVGLNAALGTTAGLAAAAYAPLAAIAAIIAGGAIGGATLNNAINAVGENSEAGKNMLNQATAPGMGVPGASRAPIFAAEPPLGGGGNFGYPTPTGRERRGRAMGGSVSGPGGPKSDVIPAMLSDGEHVLTAADVNAMGGQSGVYSFRNALHAATGGAVMAQKLEDMRTEGAMPAAAGSTAEAGTSTLAMGIDMGGEIINGLIDQAASAASQAASIGVTAGTMGAGAAAGPAAGAAAASAIGMGTSAAKRGVTFGFDMLGIGADALLQQITPFGMPRWLSQDPSAFAPQQAITGALGDLMSGGAQQAAGATVDPNTMTHGDGSGAAPGPINDLMGTLDPAAPTSPMTSNANSFLSTELASPEAPAPNQPPMFKVDNIYTTDAEGVGRELSKRGRLAQMQYTGRPAGG